MSDDLYRYFTPKQRSAALRDAELNRLVATAIREWLKVVGSQGEHEKRLIRVLATTEVPGIDAALVSSVINSLVNATWVVRKGNRLYSNREIDPPGFT